MAERIVERYPYRDRDGCLLYEVVRYRPKRFEIVGADGGVLEYPPEHVLYRLPELLAADPGETVFFVEGEKDVETLRREGLVATTNPGGARAGWKPHYAEDLRGRHVVILPDADRAGGRLAAAVQDGLRDHAASVVTLRLSKMGKDDVSDWLSHRGSIRELLQRAMKARKDAAPPEVRRPAHQASKRSAIFAARIPPLEKLLLLAIQESSWHSAGQDYCGGTASQLARMCGSHRVTVQRALTALLHRGVLRRAQVRQGGRDKIALTIDDGILSMLGASSAV